MIRKTVYWIQSKPVSLAYISDIPGHPEVVGELGPVAAPVPTTGGRPPYMTRRLVRVALGRAPAKLRDRVGFAATMSRIARAGF